jgi:hypothetical protein
MRLIDTETSRILGSFQEERKATNDVGPVCAKLAQAVLGRAVQSRPLMARVARVEKERFQAGIGLFHGASKETPFDLVQRVPGASGLAGDFKEQSLGKARIVAEGEDASEFQAEWLPNSTRDTALQLWVKEAAPAEGSGDR